MQPSVVAHALPHAPQFPRSVDASMQAPPQHAPAVPDVSAQTLPSLAPLQLEATQPRPDQHTVPVGHAGKPVGPHAGPSWWHAPVVHVSPTGHTIPQLPQFASSEAKLVSARHAPPQHVPSEPSASGHVALAVGVPVGDAGAGSPGIAHAHDAYAQRPWKHCM
jgi:hypothetical protein